jgi:hypothetical protein
MARKRKEEWMCPQCSLIGDHLKTKTPKCRVCCTIDVAEDLLSSLEKLVAWCEGKPSDRHALDLEEARKLIAKAKGQ